MLGIYAYHFISRFERETVRFLPFCVGVYLVLLASRLRPTDEQRSTGVFLAISLFLYLLFLLISLEIGI